MEEYSSGKVLSTEEGTVVISRFLTTNCSGEVYETEDGRLVQMLKQTDKSRSVLLDGMRLCKEKMTGGKVWQIDGVVYDGEEPVGVVSANLPEEYVTMDQIIGGRAVSRSLSLWLEIGIRLTALFSEAERNGLCFQNTDLHNFLVNPQNGHVLLPAISCRLIACGESCGECADPVFNAPEAVENRVFDSRTDRYLIAVTLFVLLFGVHPFEGRQLLSEPFLSYERKRELYGTQAVFLFDPEDRSNEPIKNIHDNAVKMWEMLPDYAKELFLRAFSHEAVMQPDKRVSYDEWMRMLLHLKSDRMACPLCGSVSFVRELPGFTCRKCGYEKKKLPHIIRLADYSVALRAGMTLCRAQIDGIADENAASPVFLVLCKKGEPDVIGLKNLSGETFSAFTPSGREKPIAPDEVIPVNAGIRIELFGQNVELTD